MGAINDFDLDGILSACALLCSSSDPVWVKDACGTYVACSPAFERLIGAAPGSLVGKTDRELLEPDLADAFGRKDRAILSRGLPVVTVQSVLSQGRRVELETRIIPLHCAGESVGLLYLARERESQRRPQSTSIAHAQLYEALFQSARAGIVIVDEHGAVYDANQRFADMLGYDRDELIGMHLEDWDAKLTPIERESMLNASASGNHIETRHRRKDGTVFDVDVHITWINNAQQRFAYWECRDISQRKATENALTERKQADDLRARISAMVEFSNDAIIGSTTEGLISSWNRGAEALFGYSAEQVLGQSMTLLAPPEGRQAAMELMTRVCCGEQIYHYEVPRVARDGKVVEVSMTVSPIRNSDGEIVGASTIARDTSASKRAQEALHASEARNRSLVSALAEGVLRIGADGRVETSNPAARRILGMSHEEISGLVEPALNWQPVGEDGQVLHPQYLPPLTALATGQPQRDVTIGVRRRNGAQIWICMNAEPIFDDHAAAPAGVVVSFVDITERRSAEQQLRKLSLAVAQSPHSVVITDLRARVEYVNEAFLECTGYRPEDVLGQQLFAHLDAVPGDAHTQLWSALEQASEWEGELVNHRFNGEPYVEYARVTPIHRPDGPITHCLTILEDITERKRNATELERHRHHLEEMVTERTRQLRQANQELSERSAEISDLYNRAPCGYHSLDANAVFSAMNDTELGWLGYTRDEVIGRMHAAQVVAAHSMAAFDQHFSNLKRVGYSHNVEVDFVRKDGSTLPVVISATALFDAQGSYMSSRSTVFDNAERQARERQIATLNKELERRAGEAESANRAKSSFLANMSHEIRTPMNAILGLTHLLRSQTADADQLSKLNKISSSAQHLLTIINDVLDISKIEAGKFKLELADFDLELVLQHVCSLIGERAHAKGLELVLDIEHGLLRTLHGDPTRLSQALLNYVANAVKFTEHGAVIVRAQIVQEYESDLMVRFEVQDTGIGITEEHLPRLFSAFEQADASNARKYGGTGLGLAISRRLARLMGGEAGAQSRFGHGSTFWLTARLGKVAHAALQRPARSLDGRCILLADDLPQARAATHEMLKSLGTRAMALDSGEAALAAVASADARGEPFAIVLLDMHMPTLDGLATARRICDSNLLKPPIVVLLANSDDAQTRSAAQECGIQAVLAKPLSSSTLCDKLSELLKGATTTEPAPGPVLSDGWLLRQQCSGARVLLAEDNEINQEVAVELLKGVGLIVDVANDGEQAVKLARDHLYDLILMDVQMPGLDGLDATRIVRAMPGGDNVPILAMTANAFDDDRHQCLQAGMNDHIGKPVDPEQLFKTLLKWLPQRRAASTAESAAHSRPATTDLPACFAAIPGLDVTAGLKYAMDRPQSYARRLRKYAALHADDIELANGRYSAGEIKEAARLIHSVKGAAGFIGANHIHLLADELETAMRRERASDEITRTAGRLAAAHAALVCAIRTKLGSEPEAGSQASDASATGSS